MSADTVTRYCNYPVPDFSLDPDWHLTADMPPMGRCRNAYPCAAHPLSLPIAAAYQAFVPSFGDDQAVSHV